jgi:hypothetical protein
MGGAGLNPEWGNYSSYVGDNYDFAVIPESYPSAINVPGNVVRWVLYFPGHIGSGPHVYPENEMVVSFHRDYDKAAQIAAPGRHIYNLYVGVVEMPGIREEIVRHRPGVVWVGKGEYISLPELVGLRTIDRGWPQPRIELIRYLKSCHILYSFDPFSAINDEALMCGCKVLVWNWKDWTIYQNPHAEACTLNIEFAKGQVDTFVQQVKKHFDLE